MRNATLDIVFSGETAKQIASEASVKVTWSNESAIVVNLFDEKHGANVSERWKAAVVDVANIIGETFDEVGVVYAQSVFDFLAGHDYLLVFHMYKLAAGYGMLDFIQPGGAVDAREPGDDIAGDAPIVLGDNIEVVTVRKGE